MAAVNLIDVTKYHQKNLIIDTLNLSIKQGEFLAVVGPSGCGKSTLLRLIAGLDEVSSGSILINDQCVNQIPPADRDMAMVFQSYALYPHMTVYQNMAYSLKMRKFSKTYIKTRIEEVASLLKLSELLQRKPQDLSGGQRQRVAMGRAIVRKPAVFLFDEPLSNLDAKLRFTMRHEIKKLHQQLKTTCIYVTHDQSEAMSMADRILVLNQGKIEQIGTPEELYHQPATLFVAGFTGSFPLNVIPASWDNANRQLNIGNRYFLNRLNNTLTHDFEVILSVRAEDITLTSKLEGNIPFKVDSIDNLGADKLVYGTSQCGQFPFHIRLAADDLIPTHPAIHLQPHGLHIYDKNTGLRLGGWL